MPIIPAILCPKVSFVYYYIFTFLVQKKTRPVKLGFFSFFKNIILLSLLTELSANIRSTKPLNVWTANVKPELIMICKGGSEDLQAWKTAIMSLVYHLILTTVCVCGVHGFPWDFTLGPTHLLCWFICCNEEPRQDCQSEVCSGTDHKLTRLLRTTINCAWGFFGGFFFT